MTQVLGQEFSYAYKASTKTKFCSVFSQQQGLSEADSSIATWCILQLGWHQTIIWKLLSFHNVCSHLVFLTVQKEQMWLPASEHVDMLHSCRRRYGPKCCFQFYKNLQAFIMITRVSHDTYCNQKYCTFAPMMQPQVLCQCVTLVYSGFTWSWDLESKWKFPALPRPNPTQILLLYFNSTIWYTGAPKIFFF